MKKLHLFAGIVLSAVASISAQAAPTLLAGDYSLNVADCFGSTPVVIGSLDQEHNWQMLNPNISLPKGKVFHGFNASECGQSGCIAVGNYGDDWSNHFLIAKSSPDLSSWSENTNVHGLPLLTNGSQLNNINCQGSLCIAEGYYFYGANFFRGRPLVLTSTDSGNSWTFNNLPNSDLPNYSNTGFSCGSGFCVLSGASSSTDSNHNSVTTPIFYTNANDNHAWTMTQAVKGLPVDPTQSSYLIDSMTCTGQTCVASGLYEYNGKKDYAALVFRSADQGKTWQFIDPLSSASNKDDSTIDSVSCSGSNCVGVGSDSRNTLVVVSHDTGLTWTVNSALSIPFSGRNKVSCSDKLCIVTGINKNDVPYIDVSKDGGYTWTQTTYSSWSSFNNFQVNAIHCDASVCTIVGTINSGTPLIVTSRDAGTTWTLSSPVSNLPANIQYIGLTSISGETNSLITAKSTSKNLCMK